MPYITIRQHGTIHATITTTATRQLTPRDVARAKRVAESLASVETGYYDIALDPRPDATVYDAVDAVLEIK